MSTMRNRKGLLFVLLLLVAALLCVIALAIRVTTQSGEKWEQTLRDAGPWCGEGVWISEDGDLVLICTTDAEGPAVDARILYEGEWREASAELAGGLKKVNIRLMEEEDGTLYAKDLVFNSSADLLDNGTRLNFYDFGESSDQDWLEGRLSVMMKKYENSEGLAKLPFPYE